MGSSTKPKYSKKEIKLQKRYIFRKHYPPKKLWGLVLLGIILFSVVLLVINIQKVTHFFTGATADPVKAFPTVEGFGANAVGGRGGRVYLVTNLNDSGTGSLRDCVSGIGPRTCIFQVGGTINLSTPLSITNPYITIAGQTAPGGGITLRKSSGGDIFSPKTNNIILRYLTQRPGPGGENHAVQFASNGNELSNIVVDHNSISWGVDSNIETWYRVNNMTISWSIISEGLNCSTHSKGCHSKGLMIGGYQLGEGNTAKGTENISVLNNLMAHNSERTPLMQLCGVAQVINNTTYNPQWTFAHQQLNCTSGESYVNWINNYHKKGPSSTSSTDLKIIPSDDGAWSPGKFYLKGNIGPSRPSDDKPDAAWVEVKSGGPSPVTVPADAPVVVTTSAMDAYNKLIEGGGAGNSAGLNCEGSWYNRRDQIDTRVINDVKNGTGKIIDDPSQVGGWATIDSGTPCLDTDKDGYPDAWETRYFGGLSRGELSVSTADLDQDGYTDLEEYINGTNPAEGVVAASPTPTPTSTPTPTATPTPTPSPTPTPTATPTPRPSPTLPPSPTSTPVPSPSRVPTPSPVASVLPSPVPSQIVIDEDWIGPSITLSSGRIYRYYYVYARATDVSRVAKITMSINNQVVKTCLNSSSCLFYPSSRLSRPYQVIVTATDRSSHANQNTSTITIY
jgi:hypothetical protein